MQGAPPAASVSQAEQQSPAEAAKDPEITIMDLKLLKLGFLSHEVPKISVPEPSCPYLKPCAVCHQSVGFTPSSPSPLPVHSLGYLQDQGVAAGCAHFPLHPRSRSLVRAFSLSVFQAFMGNQCKTKKGGAGGRREQPVGVGMGAGR